MKPIVPLAFSAAAAIASLAFAQAYDPLAPGVAAVVRTPAASSGLTPVKPPAGLTEHPVRTPVPANAVQLSAGVGPPPGSVALEANMPGHRRFRPPLFPNAGWDSPVVGGQKDYAAYLGVYWRAPYLTPDPMDGYPGLEIHGWTAPPPYRANIARSQAKAEEEALFERRMAFIAEQVMAAAPLRDPYGASVEPELLINGYGKEYGDRAAPVMRGEITIKINLIQPNTGSNERIGDRIRSHQPAVWLKVSMNPAFHDCQVPYQRTAQSVLCLQSKAGVFWRGSRGPWAGERGDLLLGDKGFYADARPAADLRIIEVQYGGGTFMSSELSRGRLHPHDPYGRAAGALLAVDWPSILQRAAAIS